MARKGVEASMKKRKTRWERSVEFAKRWWPDSFTTMPENPHEMRNTIAHAHYTGVFAERKRQRRAATKKRRKP